MKTFLLSAALGSLLMVYNLPANAQGNWESFKSATPEALFGKIQSNRIVAENERFYVRSGYLKADAKKLIARCQSANPSLLMARFYNMSMTEGITVASLYEKKTNRLYSVLAKGEILNQGTRKNLFMALNNDQDCSLEEFTQGYFGYRKTAETAKSDRKPSQPAPLECAVEVEVASETSTSGTIVAECNRDQLEVIVMAYSSQGQACFHKEYVGRIPTPICTFERNPGEPLKIQAKITTVRTKHSFSVTRLISKGPTFHYPVRARYLSTPEVINPKMEQESVPFRGRRFKTQIQVQVQDKDILKKDPQNEIKVQLLNLGTGKIIATKYLSTEETAIFPVQGFYEEPRFFGDAHWDEDKPLRAGINQFAVLVHDAYQSQDSNPLQLETITIVVPELQPTY